MEKRDFDELATAVKSDDLRTKIESIDEAAKQMHEFIKVLVAEFERGDQRYFIYERMPNFGSMVIPPLKESWAHSMEWEFKMLAALIIARYDVELVQSFLLDGMEPGNQYLCLVAMALMKHRVPGGMEKIIECLRSLPMSRPEELTCLIDTLQSVGCLIPDDILDRIESSTTSVVLRLYVGKIKHNKP